ncbi:MAG: DUF3014 domain-containing protein [Porticoccaceae bacterium]|nr:DUF3014 domain-containing protein [Porticoccaceae bacterium]MDG1473437.1 DUF3014 domain-containing protein [Porticoccaceae bacterium]
MTAQKTSDSKSRLILGVGTLASIIGIGGILYQSQKSEPVDQQVLSIPQQELQPSIIKPSVPEAVIPEPLEDNVTTEVHTKKQTLLPKLNQSDNFVRQRLLLMSGNKNLQTWMMTDDLLRRAASYLDGLARGVILGKIFPLSETKGQFTTHRGDNTIWMNAGNYERYNATVATIVSIDMRLLAQMFHFSRPLLEKAFSELGYQPRQMDGIILTSLDNILATPVIVQPIELTRESVVYRFADPSLESLSPLQKQLIRSGPENTQRLQKQALLLKNTLLDPNSED